MCHCGQLRCTRGRFALSDNERELCFDSHSHSDWAGDDFVLEHDADNEEDKVEQEHERSQELAHFPLTNRNGEDDEEQHEEEEDNGAEQAVAADLDWFQVVDDMVEEPGERQTGGERQTNRIKDTFSMDVTAAFASGLTPQ